MTVVALGAAAWTTVVVAGPGDDEPRPSVPTVAEEPTEPVMTPEEDLARDSVGYAESHGVSQEEARRRGSLQVEMGPSTAALREAMPDRFAGIWLEHEPEHRVVAWYTGSEDGLEAVREIAAKAPMPVLIKTGAAHTLAELLDAVTRAGAQLESGGGIDEKGNRALIYLNPSSPHAGREPELAESLEADFGVPFQVTTNAQPEVDLATYGGKRFTTSTSFSTLTCTTGFTVSNSAGATGVTTAGHCSNSLTYWENSGTSFSTTFVAELRDQYHDAQWSSVAGTEYPSFWTGSLLRSLFGTVERSTLMLGQQICHYGEGSLVSTGAGYSCGITNNLYYSPGSICGPSGNSACGFTWIQMVDDPSTNSYNLKCNPGDSGGPWFYNNNGYGIMKSGQPPGGPCTFMALDYFYDLGPIYPMIAP